LEFGKGALSVNSSSLAVGRGRGVRDWRPDAEGAMSNAKRENPNVK
jgi:hypothetical protein